MLPLNWRLSAAELAAIVDDAATPLIFVDKEYVELLAQIRSRTSTQFTAVEFDSTSRDATPFHEWLAGAPESCSIVDQRESLTGRGRTFPGRGGAGFAD